jgi:hypothetical protein
MLLVLALLVGGMAAAACGDPSSEDDSDDSAEEILDSAAARSLTEVLRALMVVDHPQEGESRRDVAVIQETIDDLPEPFEPEIQGLVDADGDGQDDDGKVEVKVDQEIACMTIAEDNDVGVTGGTC